jgi:hypothetical protein
MGGGYDSSVAPVTESSLLARPESQELETDGLAKGSTITAPARLSNKLARGGSNELPCTSWRRSEAQSVTAWAEGMLPPSPFPRRVPWLLFLSHRGFVPCHFHEGVMVA